MHYNDDEVSQKLQLDPPITLGQAYEGGYYMGITQDTNGSYYYLIVAPSDTECEICQWKTIDTATGGAYSLDDGHNNTYSVLTNDDHPAGNFATARTIAGFSDWYLPAINELYTIYANGGAVLPERERFAAAVYWSSTEVSAKFACFLNFINGYRYKFYKTLTHRVRAVRRILINNFTTAPVYIRKPCKHYLL